MITLSQHPEHVRLRAIEKAYRKICKWQSLYGSTDTANRTMWKKSVKIKNYLEQLHSFYLY